MLNASFCLQLPGESLECFRMYEALEAGCIPVIVEQWGSKGLDDATGKSVQSALEPLKAVSGDVPPFIWVSEASDLRNELSMYQDGSQRDTLQAQNMAWWAAAKLHFRRSFSEHVGCGPALPK
eukprot:gnl/MRDRNA2_/MRDRNA2_192286_c0_seq1.p1 gnl/MRDRNA2_/MRDRNA2_192286_c0~~gnl/MRDRNA2_/MRDRNA2_192286_c0_seq1.p1  ORF type:complete len:123 (+),score=25.26 gnl/MRDRNA2_/MRDRNA2_192286_c0_seq1:246-614(+)